jgi:hypothetical protein
VEKVICETFCVVICVLRYPLNDDDFISVWLNRSRGECKASDYYASSDVIFYDHRQRNEEPTAPGRPGHSLGAINLINE